MNWAAFGAVFVAFFLTHSIPVRPKIKSHLQAVLGTRGFTLAYSALSLVMLGTLIWAAKSAPHMPLWSQAPWQRYVVLIGMFVVCMIASFALGRPNPFSFGGAYNDVFDASRPGVARVSRHPLLLALALWSALHLLPNGDLAHVILFGVFFVFAFLGRWIIDRRTQRQMGVKAWTDLRRATKQVPFIRRPTHFGSFSLRLLVGTGAFVALIALHEPVVGVYPLPN